MKYLNGKNAPAPPGNVFHSFSTGRKLRTGPKPLPAFEDLTDAEWYQVYRILQTRKRRLTDEDVYGSIQLVVWDRTPGDMVCHGGPEWTF
jgi:hypothetical protein